MGYLKEKWMGYLLEGITESGWDICWKVWLKVDGIAVGRYD